MSIQKQFWVLIIAILFLNGFNTNTLFSAPGGSEGILEGQEALAHLHDNLQELNDAFNPILYKAEHALSRADDALLKAKEAIEELDETNEARIKLAQKRHAQYRAEKLEDERTLMKERIEEELLQGVHIVAEKEKWKNIREILNDSKPLFKVGGTIICGTLLYYIIKHGIPIIIQNFTQPRVISETSKRSWFNWNKPEPSANINELVFEPFLQKQLTDILLRIKTAKQYNENLPNLLFFGPPGIGKTAFAKTLAYESELDYALTSGSEFAKITDLAVATKEFRRLLNWAKNAPKGLIVFIDEAESLFINRAFSTTSKTTLDFINTFLSLISAQSQKNVMFILATNHPFKLDDAIVNRIGINIEFTLPGQEEREEILAQYIVKFAQVNKDAIVEIHHEIKQKLREYAQDLEGLSPRTIKFIAEDMIIKARRQGARLLTNDIAQLSITQAMQNLQQNKEHEEEREMWLNEY